MGSRLGARGEGGLLDSEYGRDTHAIRHRRYARVPGELRLAGGAVSEHDKDHDAKELGGELPHQRSGKAE